MGGKEDLAFLNALKALKTKQDKLVSGQTIKTINGQSILGEGDISLQLGESDYESVKVTDDVGTMGALRLFIDDINQEGRHVLFDFSEYVDGAYVCTIKTYTENNVKYLWIRDYLNNKKIGSYEGYNDEDLIEDYVDGPNVQTEIFSIDVSDPTLTEEWLADYIDMVNDAEDVVFLNASKWDILCSCARHI